MYTYIATGLVAATIAATGAWKVQDWRYTAKEAERAEQQLENERLAAKGAIRRQDAVIAAQSAAAVRERNLRNDAAGAHVAVVSLHDAAAQALRDAATSHAACTERATAFSVVLGTMADAGREIAVKADRHASDAVMLRDAWPQ